MPNLGCSVNQCSYNSSGHCSLGSINVSGGAKKENTCCESFTTQGISSNSVGGASPVASVDCSARDCVYNHNCRCGADSIDICKCGNGNDSSDTQCGSFEHQ